MGVCNTVTVCILMVRTSFSITRAWQAIAKVSKATKEDVGMVVEAAQNAFETMWGLNILNVLNASGSVRLNLLVISVNSIETSWALR